MLHVKQYVNNTLSSNTYLVWVDDEKDCLLVDCGDSEQLFKDLAEGVFKVVGVLLTHGHFDHIYGLNRLLDMYPSLKVYTNAFGRESLLSVKLNLSRYHFNPYTIQDENAICVFSDDCFSMELIGLAVNVFHVPGHNPGCLAYKIENYFFTGDAYIPDVKVITNIPKAEKELANMNYDYLENITSGCIVCAGHGGVIDRR